jgi:CBS domain-containing protein
MQLRDVMTPNVEVVHPDAPIQEAAHVMRTIDVGSLPVYDGNKMHGMVTDRDITIRATAEGRDPRQTKVREVMSPSLVYCFADQPVEEAARLMEERQIRRLPILDRNQQLVGIVALGDLAIELPDERAVGQVLEAISEPAQPQRR